MTRTWRGILSVFLVLVFVILSTSTISSASVLSPVSADETLKQILREAKRDGDPKLPVLPNTDMTPALPFIMHSRLERLGMSLCESFNFSIRKVGVEATFPLVALKDYHLFAQVAISQSVLQPDVIIRSMMNPPMWGSAYIYSHGSVHGALWGYFGINDFPTAVAWPTLLKITPAGKLPARFYEDFLHGFGHGLLIRQAIRWDLFHSYGSCSHFPHANISRGVMQAAERACHDGPSIHLAMGCAYGVLHGVFEYGVYDINMLESYGNSTRWMYPCQHSMFPSMCFFNLFQAGLFPTQGSNFYGTATSSNARVGEVLNIIGDKHVSSLCFSTESELQTRGCVHAMSQLLYPFYDLSLSLKFSFVKKADAYVNCMSGFGSPFKALTNKRLFCALLFPPGKTLPSAGHTLHLWCSHFFTNLTLASNDRLRWLACISGSVSWSLKPRFHGRPPTGYLYSPSAIFFLVHTEDHASWEDARLYIRTIYCDPLAQNVLILPSWREQGRLLCWNRVEYRGEHVFWDTYDPYDARILEW